MLKFISIAFVLSVPLLANAQTSNPLEGDVLAIRLGNALYDARCATCHGADAKGIVAPDLTLLWATAEDDPRLFQILRNGVPGSIMPPSTSPDTELWSMLAYLKSISTVPAFPMAVANAEQGEELFIRHCAECHRVNGQGGSLGPDLSRITAVRSAEALRRAIRDPDASVTSGYKAVSLVTTDGTSIRGVLKNEDAFSLQIMTSTQTLLGFRQSELAQVRREPGSLMPAFLFSQLSETDMNNLVYFLDARRRNPAN